MGSVHHLPKPAKGRVRRSNGWDAAGDLSLQRKALMPPPSNVVRLASRKGEEPSNTDLAILISLAIFAVLPAPSKEDFQQQMRCLAWSGDRRAIAICEIIEGKS